MATVETDAFRITVEEAGLTELRLVDVDEELIAEERLADLFRVNLPLEGHLDHYVEGAEQDVTVTASDEEIRVDCEGFETEHGTFDVDATFWVRLDGETARFDYEIENRTEHPLAEIWFPMLGGLHGVGERTATRVEAPGYHQGVVDHDVFCGFSGGFLGNEGGYDALSYPRELTMPWVNWYDPEREVGLYLGEHDETCRTVSFASHLAPEAHPSGDASGDTWPTAAEAGTAPRGLTFSKVAYPHTTDGTVESGTFVLHRHDDDWHGAADYYRDWFDDHFDVPSIDERPWLREEQAWFSSILKQPEDRVVGDYDDYAEWVETAAQYGVTTGELIGWDTGGLERDYPDYAPDAAFGGREGYADLVDDVHDAGANLLTFVNYQVLDTCTEEYEDEYRRFARENSYGGTVVHHGWGESTLKAALGLDTRRHTVASPAHDAFRDLLDEQFLDLVDAGTDGLQVDKVVLMGMLDFNDGHDAPPDVAMSQSVVDALADLHAAAREQNPDFAMAAEAHVDRFVPFVDVFYRAATPRAVSPLRYAFPEWTSCVHCSSPYDYAAVNGALLFGGVLVVEPFQYTSPMDADGFEDLAEYVEACLAIRERYADRLFRGDYRDTRGASVESDGDVLYRVHERPSDGARAVVVANQGREAADYEYDLPGVEDDLTLVEPFAEERSVPPRGESTLAGERVQILVE